MNLTIPTFRDKISGQKFASTLRQMADFIDYQVAVLPESNYRFNRDKDATLSALEYVEIILKKDCFSDINYHSARMRGHNVEQIKAIEAVKRPAFQREHVRKRDEAIKRLWVRGWTQKRLGARFGLSRQRIGQIIHML